MKKLLALLMIGAFAAVATPALAANAQQDRMKTCNTIIKEMLTVWF